MFANREVAEEFGHVWSRKILRRFALIAGAVGPCNVYAFERLGVFPVPVTLLVDDISYGAGPAVRLPRLGQPPAPLATVHYTPWGHVPRTSPFVKRRRRRFGEKRPTTDVIIQSRRLLRIRSCRRFICTAATGKPIMRYDVRVAFACERWRSEWNRFRFVRVLCFRNGARTYCAPPRYERISGASFSRSVRVRNVFLDEKQMPLFDENNARHSPSDIRIYTRTGELLSIRSRSV